MTSSFTPDISNSPVNKNQVTSLHRQSILPPELGKQLLIRLTNLEKTLFLIHSGIIIYNIDAIKENTEALIAVCDKQINKYSQSSYAASSTQQNTQSTPYTSDLWYQVYATGKRLLNEVQEYRITDKKWNNTKQPRLSQKEQSRNPQKFRDYAHQSYPVPNPTTIQPTQQQPPMGLNSAIPNLSNNPHSSHSQNSHHPDQNTQVPLPTVLGNHHSAVLPQSKQQPTSTPHPTQIHNFSSSGMTNPHNSQNTQHQSLSNIPPPSQNNNPAISQLAQSTQMQQSQNYPSHSQGAQALNTSSFPNQTEDASSSSTTGMITSAHNFVPSKPITAYNPLPTPPSNSTNPNQHSSGGSFPIPTQSTTSQNPPKQHSQTPQMSSSSQAQLPLQPPPFHNTGNAQNVNPSSLTSLPPPPTSSGYTSITGGNNTVNPSLDNNYIQQRNYCLDQDHKHKTSEIPDFTVGNETH